MLGLKLFPLFTPKEGEMAANIKLKMSFADVVTYFKYVPSLVGIILGAVAMVEAIRAGDPGPEKKAAVLAAIQGIWAQIAAEQNITVAFDKLIPLISILIDLAVALYNVFWKKTETLTV